MNNYSSELHPDIGTQQNPGGAAFFNNTLWYIGNGHNTKIWMTYRTLDHLNPEDDGDESSYWGNKVLEDQHPLSGNINLDTDRVPATVVCNGFMY